MQAIGAYPLPMKLRVLGCSGGSAPGRRLSGYLLDGTLAVDAGSLTTALSLEDQREVRGVLLTHSHLDHSWTFPFFVANRFLDEPRTVGLHGVREGVEAVRAHFFNGAMWPEADAFEKEGIPLASFHPLEDAETYEVIPGYEVTTVRLDHTVPTQGYLVRRNGASVMVCGDTGPTKALWRLLQAQQDLRGIVIECSFPDKLRELACLSGHLTPGLLAAELSKLTADVPVFVTHLKPEDHDEVVDELHALGDPRIQILADDQEFDL